MEHLAIYLDLDGVLADFDHGVWALGFDIDPHVRNQLNVTGSTNPLKQDIYDKIKGTAFYAGLRSMAGAVPLLQLCSPAIPFFLTAAPKFGATEDDYFLNPYWLGAAYHKRRWIESHLLREARSGFTTDSPATIRDEQFICTTSRRKIESMHRKKSDHQVLVDDRIDNCEAWAAAGGIAIFHQPPVELGRPPGYRNTMNALIEVAQSAPGTYDGQVLLKPHFGFHHLVAEVR